MKYLRYHLFFTLAIGLLSSCEDVIILDLEESAERIIIEASLDATDSVCTVLMSKSHSFYEDNNFDKIEAANISLILSNGNSYTLQESSPGAYSISGVGINAGDSATIAISLASGEFFTASTLCPPSVPLDSLELLEAQGGGPGGPQTFYQLLYNFQDIPNLLNHYRLKVWVSNDSLSNSLVDNYIVYNDEGQDGQYIRIPFFGPPFNPGDTLDVELLSIDQITHDYLLQVDEIRNQGLSAAIPYNPKGNFGEEVLGYFGVYFKSRLRAIAPE